MRFAGLYAAIQQMKAPFYASGPEMSYGLKIARCRPSSQVDAVIGAESSKAREHTPVKLSRARPEPENTLYGLP